jgi:hypothetical protein
MRNTRVIHIWLLAFMLCAGFAQAQKKRPERSMPFIIDANRPFVYLKLDHFGPGEPWGDGEPPFRIWFRFVNNCNVPVQVRTFGGPDGALGVMDSVVANPEPLIVISTGSGIEPERVPISQHLSVRPDSSTQDSPPPTPPTS